MNRTLLLLAASLSLTGCVSQSTYDDAVTHNAALEKELKTAIADHQRAKQKMVAENEELAEVRRKLTEEIALLNTEAQSLKERNAVVVSEKQAIEEALAAKDSAMKNKLADLRSAFSQELEESSIKIEMLRSDIKVDLSDDILYASGQASLTPAGEAVIRKVASQLANTPYLIRVIGNTDNVPIRGKLAERYPTNWHLAAARAVGVVRLLQEEGVTAERVEAVSRGEHYPVADNGSAEGRAANRRTEILLRVQ